MNKREKIIIILLTSVAVICMLLIWPIGIIRYEKTSHLESASYFETDQIDENEYAMQEFYPQYMPLKKIRIKIVKPESMQTGNLKFELFDSGDNLVIENIIPLADIEGDYAEIEISKNVKKKQRYYFRVSATDESDVAVQYGDSGEFNMSENEAYYLDGDRYSEYAMVAEYEYNAFPRLIDVLLYDSWIAFCEMILLYVLIEGKNRENANSVVENIE